MSYELNTKLPANLYVFDVDNISPASDRTISGHSQVLPESVIVRSIEPKTVDSDMLWEELSQLEKPVRHTALHPSNEDAWYAMLVESGLDQADDISIGIYATEFAIWKSAEADFKIKTNALHAYEAARNIYDGEIDAHAIWLAHIGRHAATILVGKESYTDQDTEVHLRYFDDHRDNKEKWQSDTRDAELGIAANNEQLLTIINGVVMIIAGKQEAPKQQLLRDVIYLTIAQIAYYEQTKSFANATVEDFYDRP